MAKRILLFISAVFLFTSTTFSQDIEWVGGASGTWELTTNWNPARAPITTDDVLISGAVSVTLSSTTTIESLSLEMGASLTINQNHTLNVKDNGNDGVELSDAGSALTINGTLNSSGHGKDGLDVNEGGSAAIGVFGKITISNVSGDGIELSDNLTNSGIISITNPGDRGIYGKGTLANRSFSNSGSVTVSGGSISLDFKNNWLFTNNGMVTLSNASTALVDDGTNFTNNGTFKGDGLVENGDGNDFIFGGSGSTIAPGTSVGTLTFDKEIDISDIDLNIEINGTNDFDKVRVLDGDITLTGANLNLSGSHIPMPGEEFLLIENTGTGSIDGTFNGIPNGGTVTLNGETIYIWYNGGDGNDIYGSYNSALPVELIGFNANPMENKVKLTWATASETNNDYFTIERSQNGRDFQKIGTVRGKGNTTNINEYFFFDGNPLNGAIYYRLKQTDFDGQFSYSDVKFVEFRNIKTVKVYPTLVEESLIIETDFETQKELTAVIRDLRGKTIQTINFSPEEIRKEITLDELIPGTYFITIYNADNLQTFKFIKL